MYSYKKIYCFEPELHNIDLMKSSNDFIKLKNAEIMPMGLWNKKESLFFESSAGSSSAISERGDIVIEVDALDNVFKNKYYDEWPTFIKMDIEGSELNALQGAENIIKLKKPKLAICIYHKPEDLLEIPMYLLGLVPEYKLYMRHYSMNIDETVLYAVL